MIKKATIAEDQSANSSMTLRVSAPGKVLLTGGYLILEEQYAGLVLSTTARFHTTITRRDAATPDESSMLSLVVESPQFAQIIHVDCSRDGSEQLILTVSDNSDRNAYIEETLLCALNGVLGLDPEHFETVCKDLKDNGQVLHAVLLADNAFYSQVGRLQQLGKTLTRQHLIELPEFLPPLKHVINGVETIAKTGLGSSAALVTSLVGAIVSTFTRTDPVARLDVVHNLAQLSHCYVQRKVGSGFDVSAACYGSQRYTRFPSSLLSAFTTSKELQPDAIASCVLDQPKWNRTDRVAAFNVPSNFHLLMGDVSCGSATVSMVKQVLQWRKANPEQSQRVVSTLNDYNQEVERLFHGLNELSCSNSKDFVDQCARMAEVTSDEWIKVDMAIGRVLVDLRSAYQLVRTSFREMGELAGVPIEPPQQSLLLDATIAVPGVLFAGVPGAGGYDAIFVLALHDSVLDRVEKLWLDWAQSHPDTTYVDLHIRASLWKLCSHLYAPRQHLPIALRSWLFNVRLGCHKPVADWTKFRTNMNIANQSLSLEMMKRRNHEEVDTPEASTLAQASRDVSASDKLAVQQTKRQRIAREVEGLVHGTESFRGLKETNEDRHTHAMDLFPGPVFCVFDRDGGVATVEYLVRHLVKTVSNEIQQHVGAKRIAAIEATHSKSREERERLHELTSQRTTLMAQQQQITQLSVDSTASGEMSALAQQLSTTVAEIDVAIATINEEEDHRLQQLQYEFEETSAAIRKASIQAFQTTDAQILQKRAINDGSTAVMVWIVGHTPSQLSLYAVNLGDSRAVLRRRGKAVDLTRDHKPSLPDELRRITKAGGFVSEINGVHRLYSSAGAGLGVGSKATTYLAVSRAFGDRSLKTPTPCVSCEPEIKQFPVQDDDLLIVIATDGVWDVLTSQEAVDIALKFFHLPKAAADAVVRESYKRGSGDNLTATVIGFGWKHELAASVLAEQAQATTAASDLAASSTTQQPPCLGQDESKETAQDEADELDMFNL